MLRIHRTWWRHQMEAFSALLAICAGNSPVPGEFPTQRPVTRSFGVYFDLRPNKRLSKQSWGWWFETPSRPFWRHRNEIQICLYARQRSIYLHKVLSYMILCLNPNVWSNSRRYRQLLILIMSSLHLTHWPLGDLNEILEMWCLS